MFKVTEDIIYVGVNDHEVDLFEGQYDVPNGMAYNSYVVLDEKVAVFDTVDAHFKDEWLANLEEAFEGRTPDYLSIWNQTMRLILLTLLKSIQKQRLLVMQRLSL